MSEQRSKPADVILDMLRSRRPRRHTVGDQLTPQTDALNDFVERWRSGEQRMGRRPVHTQPGAPRAEASHGYLAAA